jgi:putative serine protease PepD
MVALSLASGLIGAFTATALDDDESRTPGESLSSTIAPASEGEERPEATEPLSRAAEAVLPSVVSVGFDSELGTGQGSGVVISSDGQILTNNHVVAAAGDSDLTVTLSDGTTVDAEVVGTDPASDLAVIQAQDVDGLTPASLGRSSDLVVGDSVLAIGSPLGLDGSVSAGIVSALNRAIDLGQSEQPLPSPFEDEQEQEEEGPTTPSAVIDAIQTDAAINPGNSGGPLINTEGEVVGINTAIASLAGGVMPDASGNIGLGFAIPIDDARDIAEQLIENGQATHAYMGVRIAEVEPRGDDGPARGAVVAGVESGSPADDAGLEEGDVITEVDGEAVRDPAALTSAIRSHAPGDRVTLGVTRDGDETTVDVTLGTLPTGDS